MVHTSARLVELAAKRLAAARQLVGLVEAGQAETSMHQVVLVDQRLARTVAAGAALAACFQTAAKAEAIPAVLEAKLVALAVAALAQDRVGQARFPLAAHRRAITRHTQTEPNRELPL